MIVGNDCEENKEMSLKTDIGVKMKRDGGRVGRRMDRL